MRIYIFLLFCLFASFRTSAQTWSEHYHKAESLFNQNQLEAAFAEADDAMKQYISADGAADTQYASILRLLSVICYSQEKFENGLVFATKETAIRSSKPDTLYAGALTILAQFQNGLGQYAKAITTLQECRQVLVRFYTDGQPALNDCDLALGVNYYLNNQNDAAYKALEPAIASAEKWSMISDELLEAKYYLGLMQWEAGKTQEALRTFTTLKENYQATDMSTGVGYASVLAAEARILAKSGDKLLANERYKSAQLLMESNGLSTSDDYFHILRDRAQNLEKTGNQNEADALVNILRQHPDASNVFAIYLSDKAHDLQSKGQVQEAQKVYQEAIDLQRKDDPNTQWTKADLNSNLAMLFADEQNNDQSLVLLAEARRIIEKSGGAGQRKHIAVLNKQGWVLALAGNLDEASAAYRLSLEELDNLQVGYSAERVSAIIGRAELERKRGKLNTADSLLTVLLEHVPSSRPDGQYISLLKVKAAIQQTRGQLLQVAETLYQVQIAVGAVFGTQSTTYAAALEELARVHVRLGNLSLAKVELDSALLLVEKTAGRNSRGYATTLLTKGRYHQVIGDYTAAEPCFQVARGLLKSGGGADYAECLNNLALLYQVMGNYADAQPLLTEAKSIYEMRFGKMNAEYSTALQNLATLYQLEGKADQAENLLRESLAIDRQILGETHPQYGISLQNLATLYQKQGRQKEALEMFREVLANVERNLGKDHPSYATTLSNLAALYQDQSNFVLAETTWKQSVDLRRRILGEDHPDYARSLYGLAGVYHAQGQWEKALEYYEPVVTKYQKQVKEFFPSLSEKEKSAFYAKIKPVFDAYQDFCIQYRAFRPQESASSLEKLYDLQLATKAILLNASNKVRLRILQSGNVQLQDQFRQWQAVKETIVRYYNFSQAEKEKSGIDLPSLEAKANTLEKQLSSQSDAFRSQFEKEDIHWRDVQQMLKPDEAAVEIIRIKKKYVKDSIYYIGLVIKKESVAPGLLVWRLGNHLEGRRFKYHRNTIKFHFKDTLSWKYFWEPVAGKLEGASTLYLSCDGVFNKVNFNSLYNPSTGHFVIDDYTIRLLSNTRELTEQKKMISATNKSAALFGYADFNLSEANTVSGNAKRTMATTYGFEGADIPVLPATEKEVDEVARLLTANHWTVSNFKKMEATEEHAKTVESPVVLHIATHGFFLNDVDLIDGENSELEANPLFRSGVLLTGASVDRLESGRQEDGVLTAYEAMNLNLDNTNLVVLSACETGLGEVRNGEGVYGLQRSFLVAGANTVLMSLWQVDDVATQELMDAFYSNWVQGASMHDAFRKAQLEVKSKYDAPFYWGAFVLIGY